MQTLQGDESLVFKGGGRTREREQKAGADRDGVFLPAARDAIKGAFKTARTKTIIVLILADEPAGRYTAGQVRVSGFFARDGSRG